MIITKNTNFIIKLFSIFFFSVLFFFSSSMLVILLVLPLVGILFLCILPTENTSTLKNVALNTTSIILIFSVILWLRFDNSIGSFQFVTCIPWIPYFNLNIPLGIDGISLFFLVLTNLLVFLCLLASWENITYNIKLYLILFLLLQFFLIGVFCILDLLFFYIFFESVLIPMFLLIGIWGSRERKVKAAYYFFFFTLLGSVLMLLSIIYIYYQAGTTNYEILLTFILTVEEQQLLWLAFFFSFASKVPMIPFHIWLPEAHVEASTTGSVILAGILLKLGTYGFLRYSFPLFPQASFFYSPLVFLISVIGVVYASFTAIRQSDFKRIIAYTSIAHMNLVVLGLFNFHFIALEGAVIQSISHGFVASALFLLIGVVYDRHHSRLVKYYGGLAHLMPIYTTIFLFFTLCNIGFPLSSSFVGEILILTGSFKINTTVTFFGAVSMILGGCYSLWLFNRIAYGNLKIQYITNFLDLNKREVFIFIPLIINALILGIYPIIYTNYTKLSIYLLLTYIF